MHPHFVRRRARGPGDELADCFDLKKFPRFLKSLEPDPCSCVSMDRTRSVSELYMRKSFILILLVVYSLSNISRAEITNVVYDPTSPTDAVYCPYYYWYNSTDTMH